MYFLDIHSRSIAARTVGELVSEDYRYAEVFKRHGIDFCCGGGKTVESVCARKGLTVDIIESEFQELTQRNSNKTAYQAEHLSPDKLVDFIERVHHSYVRSNTPLLVELTTKVARVHGHAEEELVQIAELFKGLSEALEEHMVKEEQQLFPLIRNLVRASGDEPRGNVPSVIDPIHMMEEEHEEAGSIMKAIRVLSNEFTPPSHACNSYVVAFRKLEEFESDLHRHVHLENNVLFPQTRKLLAEAEDQPKAKGVEWGGACCIR